MPEVRLLDLFCCEGGAAAGYHRAGFDVIVGVDIDKRPAYPFRFYHGDAIEVLEALASGDSQAWPAGEFDAIHASPPCQAFSVATKAWNGRIKRAEHPNLVPETRRLLEQIGLPYVIENVPGAPLENAVQLCGSSFNLDVRRHRLFETNWPLMVPPCAHHLQVERKFPPTRSDRTNLSPVVSVFGAGGGRAKNAGLWATAMDIDWMTKHGLAEAIPPAYTEYIGGELLRHIAQEARAA